MTAFIIAMSCIAALYLGLFFVGFVQRDFTIAQMWHVISTRYGVAHFISLGILTVTILAFSYGIVEMTNASEDESCDHQLKANAACSAITTERLTFIRNIIIVSFTLGIVAWGVSMWYMYIDYKAVVTTITELSTAYSGVTGSSNVNLV